MPLPEFTEDSEVRRVARHQDLKGDVLHALPGDFTRGEDPEGIGVQQEPHQHPGISGQAGPAAVVIGTGDG
jgi:hypothetical protein